MVENSLNMETNILFGRQSVLMEGQFTSYIITNISNSNITNVLTIITFDLVILKNSVPINFHFRYMRSVQFLPTLILTIYNLKL